MIAGEGPGLCHLVASAVPSGRKTKKGFSTLAEKSSAEVVCPSQVVFPGMLKVLGGTVLRAALVKSEIILGLFRGELVRAENFCISVGFL